MNKNVPSYDEFLNEAASKWTLISDNTLVRFSGKHWPQVAYGGSGKVLARNDNGNRPSKTYSSDTSLDNVLALISNHIDKPHPPVELVKKFLDNIKK